MVDRTKIEPELYSCNICGGLILGDRYCCRDCGYFDVCKHCFNEQMLWDDQGIFRLNEEDVPNYPLPVFPTCPHRKDNYEFLPSEDDQMGHTETEKLLEERLAAAN